MIEGNNSNSVDMHSVNSNVNSNDNHNDNDLH